MSYSSKFLEDENAAKNLLLESGYASSAAIKAVIDITELSVHSNLISQLAKDYSCGEPLPVQFDAHIKLAPIKLRGMSSVDVLESLQDKNVLVRRGDSYRVMLSNMMNRVFELTSSDGKDSIRATVSKLHEKERFEDALDTIEWELVSALHSQIDMKYLDIQSLEERITPNEVLQQIEDLSAISKSISESSIDMNIAPSKALSLLAKTSQWQENISLLLSYVTSLRHLSESLEKETKTFWEVTQGAVRYPKSLLNRNEPPLIKSSWHLQPNFKNHPLIEKFKQLLNRNFDAIVALLEKYQSYIAHIKDTITGFPRGTGIFDALGGDDRNLPSSEEMNQLWERISKQVAGLEAQVKLTISIVKSADSLFQHA